MLSEEFLGMLAHELRTPLAAIIGYHDLMAEGIFGDLDPRVGDSVHRMGASAHQMLVIITGLAEAAVTDPGQMHVEIETHDPARLFDSVLRTIEPEAEGRFTSITIVRRPATGAFQTDCDRFQRALHLTLYAAIKNTAGGHLSVDAIVDSGTFICAVEGVRLDGRDLPSPAGPLGSLTACSLRLAMAHHTLLPIRGTVTATLPPDGADTGSVTVTIPAAGPATD